MLPQSDEIKMSLASDSSLAPDWLKTLSGAVGGFLDKGVGAVSTAIDKAGDRVFKPSTEQNGTTAPADSYNASSKQTGTASYWKPLLLWGGIGAVIVLAVISFKE